MLCVAHTWVRSDSSEPVPCLTDCVVPAAVCAAIWVWCRVARLPIHQTQCSLSPSDPPIHPPTLAAHCSCALLALPGRAAGEGTCCATILFAQLMLGVLLPTLCTARSWRPAGAAAAAAGGEQQPPGSSGSRAAAVPCLQTCWRCCSQLADGCNRRLHLAVQSPPWGAAGLVLWFIVAYTWTWCNVLQRRVL